MSLNSNLSGQQFFHGTTAAIKDGMVRPANDVDKHVSEHSMGDPGDMSEGDHAFAIRGDENYAWHAAGAFHKNGRRPRVYEVEPAADMKPGPWNKEHPDFLHHVEYGDPKEYPPHENPEAYAEALKEHQDEWGSPTGFKVKNRIDIMPGRQGTFPEVNWNRFKSREHVGGPAWGPDANHPSDEQAKYGLHGVPSDKDVEGARALSQSQFGHDWRNDAPPHSVLREQMGRPQKRFATLFD